MSAIEYWAWVNDSFSSLAIVIQGNDDKENSSPFDSNGLKKDEVNSSNGTNGLDDDKGFK